MTNRRVESTFRMLITVSPRKYEHLILKLRSGLALSAAKEQLPDVIKTADLRCQRESEIVQYRRES